jgi:hypothetical protein
LRKNGFKRGSKGIVGSFLSKTLSYGDFSLKELNFVQKYLDD